MLQIVCVGFYRLFQAWIHVITPSKSSEKTSKNSLWDIGQSLLMSARLNTDQWPTSTETCFVVSNIFAWSWPDFNFQLAASPQGVLKEMNGNSDLHKQHHVSIFSDLLFFIHHSRHRQKAGERCFHLLSLWPPTVSNYFLFYFLHYLK